MLHGIDQPLSLHPGLSDGEPPLTSLIESLKGKGNKKLFPENRENNGLKHLLQAVSGRVKAGEPLKHNYCKNTVLCIKNLLAATFGTFQ